MITETMNTQPSPSFRAANYRVDPSAVAEAILNRPAARRLILGATRGQVTRLPQQRSAVVMQLPVRKCA
jgi:hypothetical protein